MAVNGTNDPPLMQIPIQATVDLVGEVRIDAVACPLLDDGVLPGRSQPLTVVLESTLQHDLTGTFGCALNSAPFSSPRVSVTVPARTNVPVTIPVACAAGTSSGFFDGIPFSFESSDPNGSTRIGLRIQAVAGRTVSVFTSLPQNLTLQPGSSTPCVITVNDSGGLSLFNIDSSSAPGGVTLNIGPAHTISSSGPNPNDSRVVEVDMTINVDPHMPFGRPATPITLNWSVPTDGEHPRLAGSITFDLNIGEVSTVSPYCVFFDPPGSIGVAPNAWGLKNGLPRKSQLGWSASGSVNGFPGAGGQLPIGNEVQPALNVWQAAAPALTFTPGGNDIVYSVTDLGAPGPAGVTLGNTFPDGSQVQFSNDPAVFYAPQAPGTPSLLATAIHETGHALGLLHSTNPASVMYPFATNNETLSPEDVGAIRALYGWAPQNPIPGIGTQSAPAICGCGNTLVLAWRGIGDDHNIRIAVSTDGQHWSPQGQVPGAASSDGPALAWDGSQLWMLWKGVPNDGGLYYATWNLTSPWSAVSQIPNRGSSCGASVAIIGTPIMVWKGVDGDSAIYSATFSGSWGAQQPVPGVGTSDRPAITADPVTGIPRMVWKGIDGDDGLYTSTLRGLFWQPQEAVAWVIAGNGPAGTVGIGHPGSAFGPSLVTSGGRLSMVWRGVGNDESLHYTQAAPDAGLPGQTIAEWSTQAQVGGFASASIPAIAAFNGNTYLAWRGAGDDHQIYTTFV